MLPIDEISQIQSHKDLSEFVLRLHQDCINNPENWENSNLSSYLEAIAAWISDAEGYYRNTNLPLPDTETWETVARVLYAAKMYE